MFPGLSPAARWALVAAFLFLAVGGALGGGRMLARSARTGSLQTVPRVWAEAHANNQIAGAFGLAFIALAWTILPATKKATVEAGGQVSLAAGCLILGTIIHGVCHVLQHSLAPDRLLMGSLTGSFMEIIGWGLFVAALGRLVRIVSEESQARFEKCVLVGAVWFVVGMLLVVLVRLIWVAGTWVVEVPPSLKYGLRHMQLTAGAFLMAAGLAQPVFRGWPNEDGWRPPHLFQSMLWAATFGAFLVSVATPWVAPLQPAWVSALLGAGAACVAWTTISWFLSLRSLAGSARRHDRIIPSPWRGLWMIPSVWLLVSTAGNVGLIVWMIAKGQAPSDEWFQVVFHAFALGYVVPVILLVSRGSGILSWGRWTAVGLVALCAGVLLYVVGYPWLFWTGGEVPRGLTGVGGIVLAVSLLFLSVRSIWLLLTADKPGC
jgi:hypothetical protein